MFLCICPPPSNDLNNYTIEIIFRCNDSITHFGSLGAPSIINNIPNGKYWNGGIKIGIDKGILYSSSYGGHSTTYSFVSDNKMHKIVITRNSDDYTEIYLDDNLINKGALFPELSSTCEIAFIYEYYFRSVFNGYPLKSLYLEYFRLHDRVLNREEFFKYTNDPYILYPSIKRIIKSGTDLYLKDWSGNNRNMLLVEPNNCKSDTIVSNLRLK